MALFAMRVLFAFSRLSFTFIASLGLALALRADPNQWRDQVAALTPPPGSAPVDVVFVGSSSVRMWKTLARDFPQWRTANCGFGGSHLADSVFYFDQLVRSRAPRAVVLYAGENDLAAGVSPESVLADFLAFRTRLRAALPDTRLIYLSCKPSPARAVHTEKLRAANALIAAECAGDPLCAFVDVASPMLDANGQPRAELFGPDHLHMSAVGYALWTRTLTPVLEKTLAPAKSASGAN